MKLRQIRENKGYTQQEIADLINKDRSLIAEIETDNALPSVITAKAIARVLEFDWTLFFNNIGEELSHEILDKTTKESEAVVNE